jgi:hypothetical protein
MKPVPPSIEDVRAALVHFAELAAAYEGRGFDMLSHSAAETEHALDSWKTLTHWDAAEDKKALQEATECLLKHLGKQRHMQRSGILERMLAMLSDAYREYKVTLDRPLLRDRVRAIGGSLCFGLKDTQLDQLSSPDSESLRRGPVEAAKEALSQQALMTERTLATYKADAHALHGIRLMFGRFVSMAVAERYAAEVHRSHATAPTPQVSTFSYVRLCDEPANTEARVFDHLTEWRFGVLLSSWNTFRANLPDPFGQLHDRCIHDATECRLASLGAEIDSRDISRLGAGRVRASAVAYIQALDARATREQLDFLADAIESEVREDFRADFLRGSVETIGPLSSPPAWWLEPCTEPIQNRPVVDQSDGKREGGGIKG